jgi:starch synthase
MRILYLTEESISFSDAMVRGGAIHVKRVVEGLRDRGHDVFLLDWNESSERSFQISISPNTRFVEGPVRTLVRAVSVVKKQDIDVIVSKTRKTYLPGLVAARRSGVPHVVHIGSSLDPPVENSFGRIDVASFVARLRAPHDAYFVVCNHIGGQLHSRGVPIGSIFNIRNAVDTHRFHPEDVPLPLDSQFKNQIDELDGDLTVGFVGGLQSTKGLDDLAEAVGASDTDWSVVIAGDGPEFDRLKNQFGDSTVFLGAVPYDQIPALYDKLDVFALPSYTEGLPRVILEAQATATPVIATRVGGIPEIVEDGETGLLCEAGQPNSLETALDRLGADPSKREQLGRNGRKAVTESFSWDEMYDRYETYLAQVIS